MPKQTHNLEVPGSSPGWSTIKIPNRLLFSSLLGVFFICVNRMSTKPLLTIRFYRVSGFSWLVIFLLSV